MEDLGIIEEEPEIIEIIITKELWEIIFSKPFRKGYETIIESIAIKEVFESKKIHRCRNGKKFVLIQIEECGNEKREKKEKRKKVIIEKSILENLKKGSRDENLLKIKRVFDICPQCFKEIYPKSEFKDIVISLKAGDSRSLFKALHSKK